MEVTSSMNMGCSRDRHSLGDDDVFSNISRISCDLRNSLNSACNSDSECSQPISVRRMIQYYNNHLKQNEANQSNKNKTFKVNSARKYHHHHPPPHNHSYSSQYLLPATKSSYCGLNNYGEPVSYDQFVDQIAINDNHNNICCKNCAACSCCRNGSRKNSTASKILTPISSSFLLLQSNENDQKPNNDYKMQYNNDNDNNNKSNINDSCIASSCCIRSSSNINCNKINASDSHILAVENCSNINVVANADKVVAVAADISDDTTIASGNNRSILNAFSAEQKNSSNDLIKNNNSQNAVEQQQQQHQQKNRLLSIDSVGEANICQPSSPAETSYQSKTTIAKTSSGVRIIIDIFFDQGRCAANVTDLVGSRVETDIPQSRILNEFQQQVITINANAAANDASLNSYQDM